MLVTWAKSSNFWFERLYESEKTFWCDLLKGKAEHINGWSIL